MNSRRTKTAEQPLDRPYPLTGQNFQGHSSSYRISLSRLFLSNTKSPRPTRGVSPVAKNSSRTSHTLYQKVCLSKRRSVARQDGRAGHKAFGVSQTLPFTSPRHPRPGHLRRHPRNLRVDSSNLKYNPYRPRHLPKSPDLFGLDYT